MKSLIQYLFEALVNGPELEKNLKFEETDIDEILDILDSDEYNHFVELCGKRYDKDVVREDVFLLNNCTHFKIMYEGKLLGIFSVCLPENFNNLMSTKGKNEYAYNDFDLLTKLFYPFFNAAINKASNDILDENDYKDVIEDYLEESKGNLEKLEDIEDSIQKFGKQKDQSWKKIIEREIEQQKYKATVKLVKRIMQKTGFVSIWQLSKDAKKTIDVNQVSLLKVFFQKLIELIKNSGAKYIMAQGKDDHITNAYIKLGGFKSTEELFTKYANSSAHNSEFLEGTVIKRI